MNSKIIDINSVQFVNWLKTAKPKEKYCYFVGPHIVRARVGRTAFEAYESGLVILYQQRIAKFESEYEYWAEKL